MAELEFEDILPYIEGEGDTGRTAREKIKRNFERVKTLLSTMAYISEVTEYDFAIMDVSGNAIVTFTNGHIKTKNFDSRSCVTQTHLSNVITTLLSELPGLDDGDFDFGIKDEAGRYIVIFKNGHIKTKNFDSENINVNGIEVVDSAGSDLSFCDKNGNTVLEIKGGHIKTKNFDSRKLVNSKYDGKILSPYAIYTTCNDVPNGTNDGNLNRNMSQAVYLDHLINGLTEEKNIRFKEAVDKVVFTSPMEVTSSAETNRPTKFNDGVDILETNKAITINGYDIDEQSFNVLHRSTLNSVTKDVHPKVLVIGASVTHGEMATIPNDNYAQNYVYHLIAKQLFMKDKIDNGGNGFDITFLGRNKRTNTFEYNGTSYVCETHHEGYRGYSLLNFLEATNMYVQAFHSTTTNRFSLRAYIDRFRTMDDDGNRLPWVSAGATVTGTDGKSYTIGTEINTEAKLNSIDVCTPTHVVSALGLNQNATIEEFEELVNIIKTEYPTMQIGIALCDSSGTFFPSLHPHTDEKCIVWNDTGSRHDKLFKLMDALQSRFCNEEDEANGIYLIPFFFVSPTAEGVSSRYAPLPDAEMNLTENNRYYSSFGWVSSIHTNGYGHMNWGYSLYSWLKYSIAKSLE